MAKRPKTLLGKLFSPLGSFWLAVALLINLFLLTWLGTLEQVEKGIHQVQTEYFESWYVFAKAGAIKLVLPGGYITMGLLTINLVVGGLIRIRKSRRTVGVIIAHVGIVTMMVGGLIEHRSSTYGNIRLEEGQSGSVFEDYGAWEIAIWDASALSGVKEYLIPEADFDDLTGDSTRTFDRAELPFDLVLHRYMRNSTYVEAVGSGIPENPVVQGEGLFLKSLPLDKEEEAEYPGVYATVLVEGGQSTVDSFMWGPIQTPWTFDAGGKTWAMVLRRAQHAMPFGVLLKKFKKEVHPGTNTPSSFSSDVVRLDDDGGKVPVHIRMNEPLRHDGMIIYQASWGPQPGMPPGPTFSVLAVSRNPSDRIPWVAVSIIALGLLWTFVDRLVDFIRKEQRRATVKVTANASTEEKVAA